MSFQLIEVTIGNKSFMKQIIGAVEHKRRAGYVAEQKNKKRNVLGM